MSEGLVPEQEHVSNHRRRLVINIGVAKIWVTNIGGQKYRENIFSDNILKIILKKSFYSKKFVMTFIFFSRQLFSKMYSIQNLLPFLCIFISLSRFLLSFMFFLLNKKFSSDYWGAKKGFCPHLNY